MHLPDVSPIECRAVAMKGSIICLPVRNVEETARFFMESLGFYSHGFGFAEERKVSCPLFRDKASICLHELRPGLPPRPLRGIAVAAEPEGIESLVDGIVEVADVAAYLDEVQSRGVRVVRSYADAADQYFVVEDPNGYQLMFWR